MSQTAHNKFDQVKNWSINTYKCTKQLISEKLGKSSRTVDLELEAQIEVLRDTQRKYANILRLSRALTNHFHQVVQTQRALGEAFSEQSQRSAELQDEFTYNCETQRALVKNGETLLSRFWFTDIKLKSFRMNRFFTITDIFLVYENEKIINNYSFITKNVYMTI